MAKRKQKPEWLAHHSLGVVAIGLVALWIIFYYLSDPNNHFGAFCGNAIADWTGTIVIIFGTKFFYEAGSAESRPVRGHRHKSWRDVLWRHSLSVFVAITGVGWLILYLHMSPKDKWGQVVGNVLSEWGQMAGLIFLTKKLIERGSKESR